MWDQALGGEEPPNQNAACVPFREQRVIASVMLF